VSTRGARWLRRLDAWAAWAPSGRLAVPVVVLVVLVANLVGVGTVLGFQLAVPAGWGPTGRAAVLGTVAGYLVLALPVATLVGISRQRPTNRWLFAGRAPTPAEAAHALRMPLDSALVAGLTWLLGALVVGVVSAAAPPRWSAAPGRRRWSACSTASSPRWSTPSRPRAGW
jgi:adenylate cyclase